MLVGRWIAALFVGLIGLGCASLVVYIAAAVSDGNGSNISSGSNALLSQENKATSYSAPSCPGDGSAPLANDRSSVLGAELAQACAARRANAVLVVHFSVSLTDDGRIAEKVALSATVPTSSWLVEAMKDGAARDPVSLGRLLLGSSASGTPWQFGKARLVQQPSPKATTPSAGPSQAGSSSTVAATTDVTVAGTRVLAKFERDASLTVLAAPAMTKVFLLRTNVLVDAPTFVFTDVIGSSAGVDQRTIVAGTSISASLVGAEQLSIGLAAPQSAYERAQSTNPDANAKHSSVRPNVLGLDNLLYSIIGVLDLILVLYLVRNWRGADMAKPLALLRPVVRLAIGVAGLSGLMGVAEYWEPRALDRWANNAAEYVRTDEVVGALGVAVVAVMAWRLIRRSVSTTSSLRPRLAAGLAAGVLTLSGGAIVVTGWQILSRVTLEPDRVFGGRGGATAVVLAGVAAAVVCIVVVCVLFVAGSRNPGPVSTRAVALVFAVAALVIVATAEAQVIYQSRGLLVILEVSVVPIVLGVAAYAATGGLLALSVGQLWHSAAPQAGLPVRRVAGRWIYLLLAVLVAALMWPGVHVLWLGSGPSVREDWFTAESALFGANNLLRLVILVVVVQLARAVGGSGVDNPGRVRAQATMTGAAVVLVWAPSASWWFLPVGFAVSLVGIRGVLLPDVSLKRAASMASMTKTQQNEAIVRLVNNTQRDRALGSAVAAVLAKTDGETGSNPDAAAVQAATALRARREALRLPPSGDYSSTEVALAHAAGTTAWERASWGAKWSTAISLPWIALSIRSDVSTALHRDHFYLINSLIFTIAYDVLWWTAIGFVFGWAYPLLRGRTGMTKAILLATVIAVPLFVIRILPGPATRTAFATTGQTAAELAAVALILGLLADYTLLRRAGLGFSELKELQRLGGALTWVTSVLAAIGTAVTTIIVTGVTGVLTYTANPPQNPTAPGTSSSQGK